MPGVLGVTPKIADKHIQVTYEPARVPVERLKEVIGQPSFTALEA